MAFLKLDSLFGSNEPNVIDSFQIASFLLTVFKLALNINKDMKCT